MKAGGAHSILRQLSLRLLVLTAGVLGLLCAGIYGATWALHERSQQRILTLKVNKLSETAQSLLRAGDDRFVSLLRNNAQRRPGTRLELLHADGSVFYRDPATEPHLLSPHFKSTRFELAGADGSAVLAGTFTIDVEHDVQILRSVAIVLALATLIGALAATGACVLAVHHGLRPLRHITHQTEKISRGRFQDRLTLEQPVAELQPWVNQFNGLMDSIERSCIQLEAFNADVAHELRTPLTSLIGKTEVALTRERSAAELSETLASNLEELQRIAGMINDMLFLSRADHGAAARLERPLPLGAIVHEVLEFHEAAAAERQLSLAVVGDLTLAVDEPLFKRAVSNLLDNAARYAKPGSTLRVRLEAGEGPPRVGVENEGPPIPAEHLPRLFDRFYRADVSRRGSGSHHGLGLAIVAAIARMHGGHTFAYSLEGTTRIGFSLNAGISHSNKPSHT
jgi:two-component system heavy metal sensor histidine kinase CusS